MQVLSGFMTYELLLALELAGESTRRAEMLWKASVEKRLGELGFYVQHHKGDASGVYDARDTPVVAYSGGEERERYRYFEELFLNGVAEYTAHATSGVTSDGSLFEGVVLRPDGWMPYDPLKHALSEKNVEHCHLEAGERYVTRYVERGGKKRLVVSRYEQPVRMWEHK